MEETESCHDSLNLSLREYPLEVASWPMLNYFGSIYLTKLIINLTLRQGHPQQFFRVPSSHRHILMLLFISRCLLPI